MRLLTLSTLLCAVLALTRAAAEKPKSCCSGWSEFKGRCFLYIQAPMSWAEAKKNCLKLDGNLASVCDAAEDHYIQSLVMTGSPEYKRAWIGGSDAEAENHWFWSDGTPFHYKNWCAATLDSFRHRRDDCLEMNVSGKGCWNDDKCRRRKPSVCAKKL